MRHAGNLLAGIWAGTIIVLNVSTKSLKTLRKKRRLMSVREKIKRRQILGELIARMEFIELAICRPVKVTKV